MKSWSLHIGLNQVDPNHYKDANGNGWNGQLFGCESDAEFYKQLATSAGFSRIVSLLTSQATTETVKQEFIAAKEALEPGDLFMVTYAGHGGQVDDLNGDERDRKDETWCLFDRQFIDDELFDLMAKFKPGVKVLMFSDSCHSGTVARNVPSNTPLTVALRNALTSNNVLERVVPGPVLARTFEFNRTDYEEILDRNYAHHDEVSTFVLLIAACQDHETAKEQGIHGIFTATVQQLLSNPGAAFTYRSLFDELRRNINPSVQVPNFFTYGNPALDFSGDALFATR